MGTERSKRWVVTFPVTVTVETECEIDAEAALETATSAVSQSFDVLVPRPGPDNWARLYAECDVDDAQTEAQS